jgi:hypothetical protein
MYESKIAHASDNSLIEYTIVVNTNGRLLYSICRNNGIILLFHSPSNMHIKEQVTLPITGLFCQICKSSKLKIVTVSRSISSRYLPGGGGGWWRIQAK